LDGFADICDKISLFAVFPFYLRKFIFICDKSNILVKPHLRCNITLFEDNMRKQLEQDEINYEHDDRKR